MTDDIKFAAEPASVTIADGIATADLEGSRYSAASIATQIPEVAAAHLNNVVTEIQISPLPNTFPSGSLLQIPITVRAILGSAKMTLGEMASLGPGSVLTLDQKLSEPVILMANGNQIARGHLVVLDDDSGEIGISLTEVIASHSGEQQKA